VFVALERDLAKGDVAIYESEITMKGMAAIGEVMVELSPTHSDDGRELMALSYAGDTYNTAVYMSRLGVPTQYVTRLGDDSYSEQIIARLASENVGAALIEKEAGAYPGLYTIKNSADGEREFAYWRGQSPARGLFDPASSQALFNRLMGFEQIYLTGISLAIISESARQALFDFVRRYRERGGKVVFDSNYRPRLWSDKKVAQQATQAMLEQTDVALLTLDDEELLWNEASFEQCAARYQDLGIAELVFKRGAEQTVVILGGNTYRVAVERVDNVLDTTGAGDSFNAGYIAARYKGESPAEAARYGAKCAAVVIQSRGAILPKESFWASYNGSN